MLTYLKQVMRRFAQQDDADTLQWRGRREALSRRLRRETECDLTLTLAKEEPAWLGRHSVQEERSGPVNLSR